MNLLMRVTEQSTNIGEQTLFAISGEVVERTAFRVLFVDGENAGSSVLAEAYARANFPGSGSYESGGWEPAEHADPAVVAFLEDRGMDASAVEPSPVRVGDGPPPHVLVLIDSEGRARVDAVPFRTTLVAWELPAASTGSLDDLYDAVGTRVDELMTTLAGPEAA